MIRLFLCMIICGCGLLSASELNRQKLAEADAVRELCGVISRIEAMVRFEAADVYTICRRAFDGVKSADCGTFKEIDGGDFSEKWQSACDALNIDGEAKKIFREAGYVMGSCDAITQSERLSELKSALSERASTLSKRADETKKLRLTLGALLGAAVSVIFI